MADEIDRSVLPEVVQKAFAVSLGAAYKSVELVKDPMGNGSKLMGEAKELVTIPDDAGEGIQAKAQALLMVWMEKGAAWMQECQRAGEKFTEPPK